MKLALVFPNQIRIDNARVLRSAPSSVTKCRYQHSKCASITRRKVIRGIFAIPIAIRTHAATTNYDNFAASYDILDGSNSLTRALGFTSLRSSLLSRANGRVLEMGIGTAVNLPFYDPKSVSALLGIDTSSEMLSKALVRSKQYDIPLSLRQISAESTALPDGVFDTIVDTFSMCVYENPRAVLLEMRRLLKPEGRILLLEHSKSENPVLAIYQELTARPTAALSKGCYPNQNVLKMALEAGFKPVNVHTAIAGTIASIELAK